MTSAIRVLLLACCLLGSITIMAAEPANAEAVKTPLAAIPYKQSPPTEDLLIKVVGGLLIASLAGIGLALAVRRFLPGIASNLPGKRSVVVKEKIRLSATSQLIVVQADDEELLLAEGPQGVQLLRSRHHPAPTGTPPHA